MRSPSGARSEHLGPRSPSSSFLDSFVLSSLGAALGVWLAYLSRGALVALAPVGLPGVENVELGGTTIAFTFGLALVTTALVSIAPVLSLSEVQLRARLSSARTSGFLVASEVAAAASLLVAAGFIVQSFWNLKNTDYGFRPAGVVSFLLSPSRYRYAEDEQQRAFYRSMLDQLRGVPGALHVGAVLVLPFKLGTIGQDSRIRIEGQSDAEQQNNPTMNYEVATPGYFRAMGIRLLEGRTFHDDESLAVAIVSRSLADRMWPSASPLGERIQLSNSDAWLTVIGVVEDVRYRELQRARLDVYPHYLQTPFVPGGLNFAIRTERDPMALLTDIAAAVHSVDEAQPLDKFHRMESVMARELAPWRFNAWMVGLFAALATALAAMGIFPFWRGALSSVPGRSPCAWRSAPRARTLSGALSRGPRDGPPQGLLSVSPRPRSGRASLPTSYSKSTRRTLGSSFSSSRASRRSHSWRRSSRHGVLRAST